MGKIQQLSKCPVTHRFIENTNFLTKSVDFKLQYFSSSIVSQVHRSCLNRFIDEKRKAYFDDRVKCPQCNTKYIIKVPKMGKLFENVT